jgi:hypothetical protein
MTHLRPPDAGRAGDWIEEPAGEGLPRRGQILEVLGRDGHRHYRVRWDEEHESLHFPSPSARIVPADSAAP